MTNSRETFAIEFAGFTVDADGRITDVETGRHCGTLFRDGRWRIERVKVGRGDLDPLNAAPFPSAEAALEAFRAQLASEREP